MVTVSFILTLMMIVNASIKIPQSIHKNPYTLPGDVIYNCKTFDRSVTLTYDDGPNNLTTPILLDTLKKLNIKATFFVVVERAMLFPEIVLRARSEGHTIGLHTMTHRNLTDIWVQGKLEGLKSEIDDASEYLYNLLGERVWLFRPPFGAINEPIRKYL